MHSVANKLAQYGRGGDDTLVHMNKAEVAGLNALNHAVNNRPLSTNPVTGMPEAMDLTDILAGLGIGIAAALTGGAAAAAAPALLGATAGAAGGAGALGLGALAGAATGAGLNAGKAAIKGDQDIGMAAAFGAGSGALGGLGGAAGVGGEAAAGNVAEKGLESTVTNVATPTLNSATEGFSEIGKSALEEGAKSATENSLQGGLAGLNNQVGSTLTSQAQNAITPPSFVEHLAPTDALNSSGAGLTAQSGSMVPGAAPGASTSTAASLNPFEQSFAGLKDTIMNPGQHQGLFAAQVGAAGLEDQYKQQGLNEQASAKQAADIVAQYKAAGIMPSELPKGLTDIANRRKSFAAGGTIRDVQGLGAIPTGYVNQQPMQNFYPQSMIPQAQPLQSTQPIRHEVIGYAKGGEIDKADGGSVVDRIKRQDFGPDDSKIVSSIMHSQEAMIRAGEWLQEKMRQASGRPYEDVMPDEQVQAGLDLAGLAQTGGMPFAPASAGGTLGTVIIPEKTVNAYKLFRTKADDPDTLYPLFVNADKPVPMNEWTPAEAGAPAAQNADKVKSLLGPLAYRPGWHAGDVPVATHIGKGGKPPVYRPSEHQWAEVEFPNDVDWQSLANKRGVNKKGILVPKAAHITDQIPEGGFYRYKTSPNMTGNWLIGGEMKVNRPISDEEVKAANLASGLGVEDLPRFNEYLNRNMNNPAELSRVINSTAGKDEYFQMLKKAKDSELDDMMRMYGQHTNDKALGAMDARYNKYLKTGKAEGGIVGYADGGQVGYGYAEGGDVGGGDEGLLHGPGTGQSDGIAGLIEGAQSQEPVRLADSEFVIPADVVSALGSGSTKAGAQALYDMLDRVRQQAYGHIQQTNPVNPQDVMPV